jgi:hypothetical protein
MEAQLIGNATAESVRAASLHTLALNYVTEGLGQKNFDAIPYAENVVLRAPLCPGGSSNPLMVKKIYAAYGGLPYPVCSGRWR